MDEACSVDIQFVAADGTITSLKKGLALQKGEVIDSSRMSVAKLRDFYEEQFTAAKDSGILASLHLKATMMKVCECF